MSDPRENYDAIVAVLFVCQKSHYTRRPNLICYDIQKDARTYTENHPVVAHPPCRAWGRLRTVATRVRPGEKELAPWAIEQVRRCGGVLEHPAGSALFDYCGCPRPGDLPDAWGGLTIDIDQFHWGHRARKPTRLYIVGTRDLPPQPRRDGEPTHCITQGHGVRIGHPKFNPRVPDWEREATPPAFCDWLIEVARRSAARRPQGRQ